MSLLSSAPRSGVRIAAPVVVVAAAVTLTIAVRVMGRSEPDLAGTPPVWSGAWWVVVALLVLQSVAVGLLWSRRREALVVTSTAAPLVAIAGAGAATGATSVAIMLCAYRLLSRREGRGLPAVLAVGGGLVAVGTLVAAPDTDASSASLVATSLLQGLATLSVPALAGLVVGARRDTGAARDAEAAALLREHDALVRVAIADERTAMARELHDLAAHHLTGIAVMTAALDRQIDDDPVGARQAVAQVRQQSTVLLRDLRQLVGTLRDADAGSDITGAGLQHLEDLVETTRARGVAVALRRTGAGADPVPGVSPLAGFSAYRTVQEALTNAAQHAPGADIEIEVDAREDGPVVLTVTNGPSSGPVSPGGRLGLVGMRERADLSGSRLDAGPTDDGGWSVRLEIPRPRETEPGVLP